jgi:hypothetical protein
MPDMFSRIENILQATIDGVGYNELPKSRVEYLLLQLKAAIEGGSGVSDYEDLTNLPSINDVTLLGNKSLSDIGIVNPMVIKGKLSSVSDLYNVSNPQPGWVYFIGAQDATELREYVYTDTNTWQFLGYNTIIIDSALSATSENPVQNKVITAAMNDKADLSILTPISESAYEALATKDKPLYFIYDT